MLAGFRLELWTVNAEADDMVVAAAAANSKYE
jgi:hypothetical protein